MDYKKIKEIVLEALEVEVYVLALEEARRHSDPGEVIMNTMVRLHNKGDFKSLGLWHWVTMHRAAEVWHYEKIIHSAETKKLIYDTICRAYQEAMDEKDDSAFEALTDE